MASNRGKDFEEVFSDCVKEKYPDVLIQRLYDTTNGYVNVANPCDYILYKCPHFFAIECKSTHGASISIHSNDEKHHHGAITDKQWESLEKWDKFDGIFAGYVIWFIDKDVTVYVPATDMVKYYNEGHKSMNYKDAMEYYVIPGKKKRVYFDYNLEELLNGKIRKCRRNEDK